MKDTTAPAKDRINTWSAEAISLTQELEYANNIAARHQGNFQANGDDAERKSAIRHYAKAWKIARRIAAIKESIHWEASTLAKVQLYMLETVDENNHEQAHIYKSNAEYFSNMSKKAVIERDQFLAKRREAIDSIKSLKVKPSPVTV